MPSESNSIWAVLALSLLTLGTASCNHGPAAIEQPSINPSRAASSALEMYDANGDGFVAGDELEKAPGLKAALPRMDTNNDQQISGDEIAARINTWQDMRLGLISFGFTATLNGVPLEDAIVTFEPEAFLGDEIKPARCTTSFTGGCGPTIPKELRPDPTTPPGVHIGLYKVKISKIVDGKETIPAMYNEQTILGQEAAPDVSDILNRRVVYALKK